MPYQQSADRCQGGDQDDDDENEAVEQAKNVNIPVLAALVDEGWDLISPVPSCTLMFKQELPLMYPDEADVIKVQQAMFDPFEYLMLRSKAGKLNTDFKKPLGKISYHVACHQRVQNIGMKTREFLQLIDGTEVTAIERCSGHDGTYGVRAGTYEKSQKIARPVVNRVKKMEPDYLVSDCPMAADQMLIFHSSPEFNMRPNKNTMPPKATRANTMSSAFFFSADLMACSASPNCRCETASLARRACARAAPRLPNLPG